MYTIFRAERGDLREILALQYLAYQSEAALFGSRDIPPLKQTLSEVEAEFDRGVILKMLGENGSIIGSVRAYGAMGRPISESSWYTPTTAA